MQAYVTDLSYYNKTRVQHIKVRSPTQAINIESLPPISGPHMREGALILRHYR